MPKIEFDLKQKLIKAQTLRSQRGSASRQKSQSPLLEEGMLFLNGVIDNEYAGEVIQDLQEITLMPAWERPEEILYFINSPGGHLAATFQIIDCMRQMPIPITTYGMGLVASGGLMLLMSGHVRVATNNTLIMSHQFSGGQEGKQHELAAHTVESNIIDEMVLRLYRKSTKKSSSYVKKHLLPPHDVYLTATMALEHGLIDDVVKIS